ncbi:hypothetical protein [Paraburkholderia ferrariae]|uniref:hypothetical protein n=1 Tax=Paraburkholderia ferrariae TaxID=386056 RepID=UPI0038993B5B
MVGCSMSGNAAVCDIEERLAITPIERCCSLICEFRPMHLVHLAAISFVGHSKGAIFIASRARQP